MNGLKYIRIRCNFSINELAAILGVSRQIISAWETFKKPIPPKRLLQLSEYFGIDQKYFGEITQADQQYLKEKGMFRYIENDKEYYLYKHPEDLTDLSETRIFFLGDHEITLEETYSLAKKRKQKTLQKVDDLICYYNQAGSLTSHTGCINRGCNTYDALNTLLDEQFNQDLKYRYPFRQTIDGTLYALLLAHGLMTKEEISEKYTYCQNDPVCDIHDFCFSLAEMIKQNWTERQKEILLKEKQIRAEYQKQQSANQNCSSAPLPSIEKQIQDAEEQMRQYHRDFPDL